MSSVSRLKKDVQKDNGVKIQYCYDVDGDDDLELLNICNQINKKIIEGLL